MRRNLEPYKGRDIIKRAGTSVDIESKNSENRQTECEHEVGRKKTLQ